MKISWVARVDLEVFGAGGGATADEVAGEEGVAENRALGRIQIGERGSEIPARERREGGGFTDNTRCRVGVALDPRERRSARTLWRVRVSSGEISVSRQSSLTQHAASR